MKQFPARTPSPAMVLALIALFVSLGGTALALKQNSVKSRHIVNGQVKTPDLAGGAVTSAKLRDGGVAAADLRTAAVGPNAIAPDAVNAASIAANAVGSSEVLNNSLTGADINEGTLSLPGPEPWHVVGAPGEPEFSRNPSNDAQTWVNYGAIGLAAGCGEVTCGGIFPDDESFNTAAFYRDGDTVHLRGQVAPLTGWFDNDFCIRSEHGTGYCQAIFELPPGYQPAKEEWQIVPIRGWTSADNEPKSTHGIVAIAPNGEVKVVTDYIAETYSLDGISFRADH